MNDQQITDPEAPPANSGKKPLFLLLWPIATLLLCGLFILAAVPHAEAQGVEQESKRYFSIIQNVFDFIQKRYVEEVDPKVIYEGALSGMLNALGDPYTAFLPEAEMSDLNDTTQGNFGGVGLYISAGQLQSDGTMRYVEVASPIEDTPGWRAGINPGDRIIEIDSESTDGLTMNEVLNHLRGKPATDVDLKIRRGEKLEFTVTLTRAVIEVPTVKHAMIGSDIGYLKLLTFTPMSVDRTREALADFKAKNYKALLLDLRNNYGGLLQSAVGISDLFLEGGVVVSTKSRISSENVVFNARQDVAVPAAIPMVVLINRGSASASEIVAGALKDRGRAYLVGEKSYGKGSVQQVYPLEKAGFRITTARYYTPSDVNIDKIGIPPDKEVLFPEFTAAEAEVLNGLLAANTIPEFVAANPNAGADAIEQFARELNAEYKLELSLLRRLIRNEQNRTVIAPVYDLEYDVQLQEAVNILHSGNYGSLMRTTKTLRDLQNETLLEEDTALAS
jgi:carboxyl-terminal processing protease